VATLNENDLKLFVDSIRNYLKVTTRQEPQITSAYLGTGDVEGLNSTALWPSRAATMAM
jgi:chemotaxis protein CheX